MGTLKIRFTGANVYFPHRDERSLMVVLPNGTEVGNGRKVARDGTPMEPHWPVFYERIEGDRIIVPHPYHFAGDRLTFDILPSPPAGHFSALTGLTSADWLAADDGVIARPDKRVAAFVGISSGRAAVAPDPVASPCNKALFPRTRWSVDRTVLGVDVTVEPVDRVKVRRSSFVGVTHQRPILYDRSLSASEVAYFIVGNLCGGKVLEHAENGSGRKLDEDFKWVYELSTNPEVETIRSAARPLPRPEVDVRGPDPSWEPHAVFASIAGGGGLNGCECGGYLADPVSFS